MKSLLATASLLTLLLGAPLAQSAEPPAAPNEGTDAAAQAQSRVNQQDRDFIRQADMAGRAEIDMGRLAMKNAADPAVREFGRWMVTDHLAIGEAITRLGTRLDVPPATGIDSKDQSAMQRLQGLTGAAFDREYIPLQISDHHQAIALFEREASAGEQPVLKAVAQHALPMLRQHLAEAEELAKLPAVASSGASPSTGSTVAPPAPATNR